MEPASQISRLPMASNSPTRLPSLGLSRSNSTRSSKLPTANSTSIPTPSKLAAPSSSSHHHQQQNAEGSNYEISNSRHSLSASASVSHSPSRIPGFSNAGKKGSIADRARLFEKLDGSASAPNASPTRLSLSGADSPRRVDSHQKSLMPRPVAARRRSGSFSDSVDDTPTKPSRGRPISIAGPFLSGVPIPKFTDSVDKDRLMMPPPSKLGISRSRSRSKQEEEDAAAISSTEALEDDVAVVEEDVPEEKDHTVSGMDGNESPGETGSINSRGGTDSDAKESEEPPEPDADPPVPSSAPAEKQQKAVQIAEPPLPSSKPTKHPLGKATAAGSHAKHKSVSAIAPKPAAGATAGLTRSASMRKPSAKPPVPKFGQAAAASAAPAPKTTTEGVISSTRARPRSMVVDSSKFKAVSGSAEVGTTSAKEAPARMASSTISVAKKHGTQAPSKLGTTRSISLAVPKPKSISDEKGPSKPKSGTTASTTRAKTDSIAAPTAASAAAAAAAAAAAIQRPSSAASNKSDTGSKKGSRPPSRVDAPLKPAANLQQSLKIQKPSAAAVAKASKDSAPPSPTKNRAASPTKSSRPQFNNFKKEYPKAEKANPATTTLTSSTAPPTAALPIHVFHAQVRLLQLSELHAASFNSTKGLRRSAEAKLKEKFDSVKQKNSKITARERVIQESFNAKALGLVFDSSASLSTGAMGQEGRGHRKSLLANADEAIQNFSETVARMSALFAETPGPGEYTLLVSKFTNWLDFPETPTEHADGLGPEFHHELTRVRRKLDTGLRVLEGWDSLLKSSGDEDIEKKSSLGKMISDLLTLVRGGLEELGHIVTLESSTVAEARKELREKVDGILKEQSIHEEEMKPLWS